MDRQPRERRVRGLRVEPFGPRVFHIRALVLDGRQTALFTREPPPVIHELVPSNTD
jgi:hypothetical protein